MDEITSTEKNSTKVIGSTYFGEDDDSLNVALLKTRMSNYFTISVFYHVNWICECGCLRDTFEEVVQLKQRFISEINIELIQEFKLRAFIRNKYHVSSSYWNSSQSRELKIIMCFVLSAIKFLKI